MLGLCHYWCQYLLTDSHTFHCKSNLDHMTESPLWHSYSFLLLLLLLLILLQGCSLETLVLVSRCLDDMKNGLGFGLEIKVLFTSLLYCCYFCWRHMWECNYSVMVWIDDCNKVMRLHWLYKCMRWCYSWFLFTDTVSFWWKNLTVNRH